MSAVGALSPSGASVVASIYFFELSPNAGVRERTGLTKFTDRERSGALYDAGDKIFPLGGKRCRVDQKYRQAQPGDLTLFSRGVTRAH
jgi:hypothetical protein